MIDYDKLKYIQNLINEKILEQNDYGKHLDGEFYGVGERMSTDEYMKLKFFNIGYGNALEMMMGVLSESETVGVRTREALIDAQLEYWQSLKFPEFEGKVEGFTPETVSVRGVERAVAEFGCVHETDAGGSSGGDYKYKCKHCGDYYLCY